MLVCARVSKLTPPRLGGCLKYDLNNAHEFPFFLSPHTGLLSLVSKKNLC